MEDLFAHSAEEELHSLAPLAARMRPRGLDEFVGQEHALGPDTALRREIEEDRLGSLILYGPPGCGKTSLARVIAETTRARFVPISAVTSGVKELRRVIEEARDLLGMESRRTILFVDEIHRFNRSQQDALLHAVEDGLLVLVGATTENPFFEVNAPLISRSRVVELRPLTGGDVRRVLERALDDRKRGVVAAWSDDGAGEGGAGEGGAGERGTMGLEDLPRPDEEAMEALVTLAGGDARVALATLESAVSVAYAAGADALTVDHVREATSTRVLPYDREGDVHYDVISAFIKSMRGSDPDAAVYWLARMVYGGEDPKFIARRILIFASEDVGNADPRALLVAHAAVKAAEFIGWPECRINLAQAAIHMALAPKSNAAITAIDSALREVREGPAREVPSHLRDGHYSGAEELGRGVGYRYPHSYPDARVEQRYLPEGLEGRRFFESSGRGWEQERQAECSDTLEGPETPS